MLSVTSFNAVTNNHQQQKIQQDVNQEMLKREKKEALSAKNPFDYSPEQLNAQMANLTKMQTSIPVETTGTLAFSTGAETAGTMASASPSAGSSSSSGGSVCAVA